MDAHKHSPRDCQDCRNTYHNGQTAMLAAIESLAAEAPELTAANLAKLTARLLRAGAL